MQKSQLDDCLQMSKIKFANILIQSQICFRSSLALPTLLLQTALIFQLYTVDDVKLKLKIMKNLLIATDFSVNANHAAGYGYFLASQLKEDIILCNTFFLPADVHQSSMIAWHLVEYDELN